MGESKIGRIPSCNWLQLIVVTIVGDLAEEKAKNWAVERGRAIILT